MVPDVGKKYGPYEILGNLGGGGMGYVHRAWDARLHREVAIKLLHNEFSMPGMRERFLREARAASALNHPNICTIFDIGEQNGDPYLVMELLQGETLKDRIDYRTIQVEELVCIAREVAEALGAAHAKGVIHRDIKPANIFLVDKPNGGVQAKVLDFGLAKFQGGVMGARTNRSLELTAVGATVGTLAYMSPEQARGEVLDSRSDLFSLGVVLYEMATRHIPFPGATSALVFVQLLNHQPESVRNWNEAIPRELDRIIFKLMAKERTARFQTARELDEALGKLTEKPTGWLRKVTSNVPLVKAPDPIAREKRISRKSSDSYVDPGRAITNPPPAADHATPPQGGEPQFLRPVARVPRGDGTPRPKAEFDAGGIAASASPIPLERGIDGEPLIGESPDADKLAVAPLLVDSKPAPLAAAQPSESGEFRAAMASPFDPPAERKPLTGVRRGVSPRRIGLGVAVLAILVIAGYLIVQRGHFRTSVLTDQDTIVLTEIENRTGDKTVDGAITEGLQIALMESPFLQLRSGDAYRTARHQVAPDAGDAPNPIVARNAVAKLGVRAYLSGTITGFTPPYIIHVDLLSAASNDLMASAEERVPSLQQLAAGIDHLAISLRSNLGEGSDSIQKFSNPLAREATTNLEALHALSLGDAAFSTGKSMEALAAYQQAATLDPKFIQAQLRLAVLYRRQRAEVASAEASRLALAAADNASERTREMAQYHYEMNASGDYTRASNIIRQVLAANPHDPEALEALSRTLRLQGRVAEALQTAQQAYGEDPYNVEAYTQAENSLIGLDRYEAAAQLETQVQRLGLEHPGGTLTAAYLGGRQDLLDAAIATFDAHHTTFRLDWNYGIYLDNAGKLTAGAALWRGHAAEAQKIAGLQSTAGFLLSQGALDRALLGDCNNALAMAREADQHPQGLNALFNTGMAYGLCGEASRAQQISDQLLQKYPQSFAVKGFYAADIKAAMLLHDQDPAAALEILRNARQYDLISLTPILRGRAHVSLRQVQIGIVDFQTVLAHRGVPFIVGTVGYPAAQIGVARAFAATGDLGNSAEAYRRFLNLWKHADPTQPLLMEARAHSR